jgi:hypothetical protein
LIITISWTGEKMKKIIMLVLIVLLVGCSKTVIEYRNVTVEKIQIQNVTIEKNVTVFQEKNVTVYVREIVNNSCVINNIQPTQTVIKKAYNLSCESKFNEANTRMQYFLNAYQNCMMENNSRYFSSLNYSLSKAKDDLKDCQSKLANITRLIQ